METYARLITGTSDADRTAWINAIVGHMWPHISQCVGHFLKEQLQPHISKKLQDKWSVLRFEFTQVQLGDKPAVVEDIKVYTSPDKPNELALDIKIRYESDQKGKIDVKVAGCASAGVVSIKLSGVVRVELNPLIGRPPLFAAVSMGFLNCPELDLDLTGLGNIFETTKLTENYFKDTLMEKLAGTVVLPNRQVKVTEQLGLKVMQQLRYPLPQGVLRLKVQGHNLKDEDMIGESDPYLVMRVGGQALSRSKTVSDNLNPSWEDEFEFLVDERYGQEVSIGVFDEDPLSSDDALGRTSLDIASCFDGQNKGVTPAMLRKNTGENIGSLNISSHCFYLSKDPKHAVRASAGNSKSCAVVVVYLDSTDLLAASRSAVARVTMGSNTFETHQCDPGDTSTTWEANCRFFVTDPDTETVDVQIEDKALKKVLGKASVPLKTAKLSQDMETTHKVGLTNKAAVSISLTLRGLVAAPTTATTAATTDAAAHTAHAAAPDQPDAALGEYHREYVEPEIKPETRTDVGGRIK